MTKQEIKSELENVIYVLETLENDYAALKLRAVLDALSEYWNQSDYYSKQIEIALHYNEAMECLK